MYFIFELDRPFAGCVRITSKTGSYPAVPQSARDRRSIGRASSPPCRKVGIPSFWREHEMGVIRPNERKSIRKHWPTCGYQCGQTSLKFQDICLADQPEDTSIQPKAIISSDPTDHFGVVSSRLRAFDRVRATVLLLSFPRRPGGPLIPRPSSPRHATLPAVRFLPAES